MSVPPPSPPSFWDLLFPPKKSRQQNEPDQYACPVCNLDCQYPSVLNDHMNTHTGDKPYRCEICGGSFKSRVTYKRHKQLHQRKSEEEFACDTCPFVSASERYLKIHRKMHTSSQKKHKCEICGAEFNRKSSLKEHQKPSKRNVVIKCEWCTATSGTYICIETHEKKYHAHMQVPPSSVYPTVPKRRREKKSKALETEHSERRGYRGYAAAHQQFSEPLEHQQQYLYHPEAQLNEQVNCQWNSAEQPQEMSPEVYHSEPRTISPMDEDEFFREYFIREPQTAPIEGEKKSDDSCVSDFWEPAPVSRVFRFSSSEDALWSPDFQTLDSEDLIENMDQLVVRSSHSSFDSFDDSIRSLFSPGPTDESNSESIGLSTEEETDPSGDWSLFEL